MNIGKSDPVLSLRARGSVHGALEVLAQLRRETDFPIPEVVPSFWEERVLRAARKRRIVKHIADVVGKAIRERHGPKPEIPSKPTDIPVVHSGMWVILDEGEAMFPEENNYDNALWRWMLNRWRLMSSIFHNEQKLAFAKLRQNIVMAFMIQYEDDRLYMESVRLGLLTDFLQAFGPRAMLT